MTKGSVYRKAKAYSGNSTDLTNPRTVRLLRDKAVKEDNRDLVKKYANILETIMK